MRESTEHHGFIRIHAELRSQSKLDDSHRGNGLRSI